MYSTIVLSTLWLTTLALPPPIDKAQKADNRLGPPGLGSHGDFDTLHDEGKQLFAGLTSAQKQAFVDIVTNAKLTKAELKAQIQTWAMNVGGVILVGRRGLNRARKRMERCTSQNPIIPTHLLPPPESWDTALRDAAPRYLGCSISALQIF